MEKATSETIKAKLGNTTDPTNGAWQWRGGQAAKNINNSTSDRYINITYAPTDAAGIIVEESNAYYFHIYF